MVKRMSLEVWAVGAQVVADAAMRVRTVRKQLGMTLKDLAERASLTESYLSKLERGHSVPSISVALRLAHALGVDVGALFGDQRGSEAVTVVRADERTGLTPRTTGDDSASHYEAVATTRTDKAMLPFVVRPGSGATDDGGVVHAGEEFVFVHSGPVTLVVAGSATVLHTGDAAYFDGTNPHRLMRVAEDPAEVVVVISAHASDPDEPIPAHD